MHPVWGEVVTQSENGVGGWNNPPDQNSGGLSSQEGWWTVDQDGVLWMGSPLDEAIVDEE